MIYAAVISCFRGPHVRIKLTAVDAPDVGGARAAALYLALRLWPTETGHTDHAVTCLPRHALNPVDPANVNAEP
jgi:hypothetical protein